MKKHLKKVHGHVAEFHAKHNVGYRTFGLLALLAVETNVLAAYNLFSATV